jgi:hypothetical protein
LDIQDVFALSFFFDKGASPQPVHQLMHTASLLTKSVGTTKFNHYKQTKSRVDTKINQKKTRPVEELFIGYSINMPSFSSLEKEVLSNLQHPVAPSNHVLPQLQRKKESPLLNPIGSPSDNLQKISTGMPVKDDIITACPYGPTNG